MNNYAPLFVVIESEELDVGKPSRIRGVFSSVAIAQRFVKKMEPEMQVCDLRIERFTLNQGLTRTGVAVTP